MGGGECRLAALSTSSSKCSPEASCCDITRNKTGAESGFRLPSWCQIVSDKNHTVRAKYSLIRLSRAAAAEWGKDQLAQSCQPERQATVSQFSPLTSNFPSHLFVDNESQWVQKRSEGVGLLSEGSERSEVSQLRMSPSFCSLCSTWVPPELPAPVITTQTVSPDIR